MSRRRTLVASSQIAAPPAEPPPPPAAAKRTNDYRAGKRGLLVYVSRAFHQEPRQLSIRLDEPIQTLGVEGFRLVMEKHGVKVPPS